MFYAATCFFCFHIRGCSLQEPQLIVVVANVHELCALWIKVLSDRQQRDFVCTHPHSWHLFAVFTRTHPHSHNRGQTSRNRSALMPHSRVFITFIQVALIRTHGGIMTFSPHSSALIRTHPHSSARSLRLCTHASSTLASERMLSRNLYAAWMCFSRSTLSSSKSMIFIHEPKQHKTIVFFKKTYFIKTDVKKQKKLSSITSK